jgi:hypothetical protein
MLPLTVLRRLDCVLEKARPKVLARYEELNRTKQPAGIIDSRVDIASEVS